MQLAKLGQKDLPKALSLKRIMGPSFVLLGLGLGSGELILWPYLSANWGLGIIWGAILGISFQFFLNMEIERYTLIKGESVFVGLGRIFGRISPIWFILSTLIPWMWPGIILSSAAIIGRTIGWQNDIVLAVGLMILIGVILTLGSVVYKTQETFQKVLIFLGVPFILVLALMLSKEASWIDLLNGMVGKGNNYWLLPKGLPLISFLGAFAYSGAGGTLNLAQSFYIKEKGYGMGKFGGKITSILTGKKEKIRLEGVTFPINKTNMKRFNEWWRVINLEHALVFWLTGAVTITMLSLLAFNTVWGNTSMGEGIGFLFEEAKVIGIRTIPLVGSLFLVLAGAMLFSTQLSIMDATSRIMSENMIIMDKKRFKIENLPNYYYLFLWTLILLGIIVIVNDFKQPLELVIIGAALNAFSMFVYSIAMLILNLKSLEKELRPSMVRIMIILAEISFFGYFSVMTLKQSLFG